MTRKRIIFVMLILLALVAVSELVMYSVFRHDIHLEHNIDVVKEYPQIDVDTALKDPERYPQTIAVEGTVCEVTKGGGSFALAGSAPTPRLKVEFKGSSPAVNDKVVVIGMMRKMSEREYVFAAQEVELR